MNPALVKIRLTVDCGATIRTLSVATVSGVFLALLGPFGTGSAPLLQRLVYWLSLAEIGAVCGIAIRLALRRMLDPGDRHVFLIAMLTAVSVSFPASAIVFGVTKRLFQADGHGGGFGSSGDLLGFAPPVLLVSMAVSLINALTHREPVQTRPPPAGAPPPRFLERLPQHLKGAEIYAVQAEDHYLRLHTSRGSDLILMRLSDAIAELEGLEGAQTHRSWWVSKTAVKATRRAQARAILQLTGGVEAPVSKTFISALRADGWFQH